MTFLDRIKETSTSTGTGAFTLGGAVLGYKVFTNGTYKYCIVNETESEWEVGEGTVASGVLTRTTIEASSNGGSAVSFSAGTKYVFNTVSAAYVNSLVPYTGATASVNLGVYGIISDYLQLSTTPTASGAVGRTLWNDSIGSTQTTLKGGSVVLKNGVDLVARVVNKVTPAATLTKATYKAVRVSGAQGQRLAIAYAQANNDNNSADTIGLVCETIAANQEGFIITVGQLSGINTTGSLQGETWADGDVLYLSPTTAGNLTNIKPTGATGHIVVIGYVEYAHAINGSIYVKIMNGWELDELHNVYINAVANNQVLVYESATDLWKNKSIATILGYTPQAAITLTTTGSSGASTFVSNTLNIPTYTLAGLGGQAQLNGTGFVKATGTTISYDNTTYAADSLVVHLAGAENITGVKTFQNALQTTAGNNLLNTGGGNTVIGYTADPASSATYKLDVNGQSRFVGNLLSFNGSNLQAGLYTSSGWGRLDLYYGSLAIRLDPSSTSYMCLAGANLVLGATTGNNSAILYLNSTVSGFRLPNMTTLQKNAIVSPTTSLLVYDTDLAAFQYYTGSAWTGLGGGITGSGTAGQLTYWSGTSAVTGSATLTYTPTTSLLVNNSVTASSAIASGINFTPTLIASANNDVLVGLDIRPTFTNGAFTGLTNYSLRIRNAASSNVFIINNSGIIYTFDPSLNQATQINGTGGSQATAIGNTGGYATASGMQSLAIGRSAQATAQQAVSIGYNNVASGTNSIAIGSTLSVGGTQAISFGYNYTNNYSYSISFNGVVYATNQFVANNITDVYFGNGVRTYNTDAIAYTINGSGGGTAANTAGGDLILAGGKGIGSANPGVLYFSTSSATGSGLQTLTKRLAVLGNTGNVIIQNGGAFTDGGQRLQVIGSMRVGTTAASAMYWDDTNNRLVIGNTSGTATLDVGASTTSAASLRIRSGTAPTTPNEGDIWQDGTNIKIYIGGSTKTFTII